MTRKRKTQQESHGETETLTKERTRTRTPKQYRVILLNDDYTTMDFVVSILETIFFKSPAEAVQIMLKVHSVGKGVCGMYEKQIAETKVLQVHERARAAGYPLRCVMEEE